MRLRSGRVLRYSKGKATTRPKAPRYKYRGKGKKRVIAKSTYAGSALINTVKRIMNAGEEKKCVAFVVTFPNVPNIRSTTTSLAGNYQVISPSSSTFGYNINQGTSNAQRIGNRVRTVSLITNYTITPNGYNATTNPSPQPQVVIIYFFKSKLAPSSDVTVSDMLNRFFENGPTMAGLSGYLMDLNRKICPDTFTYLTHRVHKIGYASNSATGAMPNYANQSNNDFKLFVKGKINLTKYCPKVIRWDDNSLVNNEWVFCVHQTLNVGDVPGSLTTYPVSINYDTYFTYLDA